MQTFTARATKPDCKPNRLARARAVPTTQAHTQAVFKYHQIAIDSKCPGISLHDITPQIRELIAKEGVLEGYVNVLSRHTTTAVTINENESRLTDDIRQWLRKLAPPSDPYLHNDLHVREAPADWPGVVLSSVTPSLVWSSLLSSSAAAAVGAVAVLAHGVHGARARAHSCMGPSMHEHRKHASRQWKAGRQARCARAMHDSTHPSIGAAWPRLTPCLTV